MLLCQELDDKINTTLIFSQYFLEGGLFKTSDKAKLVVSLFLGFILLSQLAVGSSFISIPPSEAELTGRLVCSVFSFYVLLVSASHMFVFIFGIFGLLVE